MKDLPVREAVALAATPPTLRHLRLVGIAAFGAMAAMRCTDPMLRTLATEFERSVGEVSLVVSAFATLALTEGCSGCFEARGYAGC